MNVLDQHGAQLARSDGAVVGDGDGALRDLPVRIRRQRPQDLVFLLGRVDARRLPLRHRKLFVERLDRVPQPGLLKNLLQAVQLLIDARVPAPRFGFVFRHS
jgi:hypothetical protein